MGSTTAGNILVATPVIGLPPFARSVVLMLEHDESGAVGLILNAPTNLPVSEHLPAMAPMVSPPDTVFLGGPVSTETAILLGRSSSATFMRPSPLGDIGILDPDDMPADLTAMRVFAGYSGWDDGQLEAELASGSWWVVPTDRAAVFPPDTAGMWQSTVGRAPGTIAFHRTFPDDITLN